MKTIISLANSVLPSDTLRAQFRLSTNNQDNAYLGVVTTRGVWYKVSKTPIEGPWLLDVVPKNYEKATQTELGFITNSDGGSYPYDEFKFSKVSEGRVVEWLGLSTVVKSIDYDGTMPTSRYVLFLDGNAYEMLDGELRKLWDNVSMPGLAVIVDLDASAVVKQLLKTALNKIGTHVMVPSGVTALHATYTCYSEHIYEAVIPLCHVVKLEEDDINGFKIKTNEKGYLEGETIMSMREKLGSLKSFNDAVSEPTVEEVVQDINLAAALKEAEVKVEPVSKVVPLEVNENKVHPLEVKPVMPVDTPKPTTPVELPEADTLAQKVQEMDTIATPAEEPTPVTIDSLRYQFTEVKTMVAAFDKALREYAKVGACNKKIQTELDKLRNENIKLRDEIKARIKDSEQLEKIKKYLATMAE